MLIKSNTREGNKVVLEVEEDYAGFKGAVDRTLVEAGKEVKIPGFRPGKAPKDLVERALDKEAIEERAASKLISELYPQIITESKIDPVDYPNVEIVQQKKNKPFVFKLSVDVYPEVKLGKYKGLKVEKRAVAVTDEDIMKVMGDLNERMTRPGPDGKKEVLPLDDEFAKKVSRYGTLTELKEEVRESMLKQRQSEAEAEVKDKLIAAASTDTKVDIPAGMIDREVDVMLDELNGSLAQSGLTLEDYLKGIRKEEKALREELRKSAEMRVKGKIVLKAVAEAEKLVVSEEDINTELKSMSESSGEAIENLRKRLDEGAKNYIEDYLLRRKALELLAEKAKVEIKEEAKQ